MFRHKMEFEKRCPSWAEQTLSQDVCGVEKVSYLGTYICLRLCMHSQLLLSPLFVAARESLAILAPLEAAAADPVVAADAVQRALAYRITGAHNFSTSKRSQFSVRAKSFWALNFSCRDRSGDTAAERNANDPFWISRESFSSHYQILEINWLVKCGTTERACKRTGTSDGGRAG